MLDKLKEKVGKIDKSALSAAIGLMLLSWAALPIIYYLLIRRKNEKTKSVGNTPDSKTTEDAPSPLDT